MAHPVIDAAPEPAVDEGAVERLLIGLAWRGYDFTVVTPETHRIVLDRDGDPARDLRDAFGWNRPFAPEMLDGLFDGLAEAGLVARDGELWRSRVRVACVDRLLFAHSAFPTDDQDAVFLGPDSYRFVRFLDQVVDDEPVGLAVDFGAGAGVGGLCLARARTVDRLVLTDVNPRALDLARANAAAAEIAVETYLLDKPSQRIGDADLVIANPPFIAGSGKTYSDGGANHGAGVAMAWAKEAVACLAPGGRLAMYTGSPIVNGKDILKSQLEAWSRMQGLDFTYQEIDPDIFGATLKKPAYRNVERIAAVGLCLQTQSTLRSTRRSLGSRRD